MIQACSFFRIRRVASGKRSTSPSFAVLLNWDPKILKSSVSELKVTGMVSGLQNRHLLDMPYRQPATQAMSKVTCAVMHY